MVGTEGNENAGVVARDVVHANDGVGQQPDGDDGAEERADKAGAKLLDAEEDHDDRDGDAVDHAPAVIPRIMV